MEANDGRRASRLTLEERKATAIECFVRYFGPRAAHPLEYLERDWTAEEFSRGCYGAHFTPGVWGDFGTALTEPVGRLHWAGAECSRCGTATWRAPSGRGSRPPTTYWLPRADRSGHGGRSPDQAVDHLDQSGQFVLGVVVVRRGPHHRRSGRGRPCPGGPRGRR